MAVLAVVDQVDAGRLLARDHLNDGAAELPLEVLFAAYAVSAGGLARRPPVVELDQVFRAGQAARVASQDPARAFLHLPSAVRCSLGV